MLSIAMLTKLKGLISHWCRYKLKFSMQCPGEARFRFICLYGGFWQSPQHEKLLWWGEVIFEVTSEVIVKYDHMWCMFWHYDYVVCLT